MNMTFEQLITDAMEKEHKSKEQIAKAFTDALNSIDNKGKERENRLAAYRSSVYEGVRSPTRHPIAKDIGYLAALYYAHKHPEWTAKDLNDFATIVNKSAEMTNRTYGKTPTEQVSILSKEMTNAIQKGLEDFGVKVKIQKSDRDKDEEVICSFLNDLFD